MSEHLRVSRGYKQWLKSKECNGCGSGWSIYLVPDTIYGMNIRDVCCPHDFDYKMGRTNADKEAADRRFKNNLYRKIELDKKWWRNNRVIKALMRRRARIYYQAVKEFGGPAFWDGKNNTEELILIENKEIEELYSLKDI